MPVPGRGRLVNEQMFGTWSMYRNVRARGSAAASTAISNYFFTPLFSQPINPNWPLTITQVAFATDPFNNNVSQQWTDISSRVQSLDSSRGRQYELDVVSTGEAAVTLYDLDEAFNPTNPSSPYYPNVKVYRRLIDQAMWPSQPVGGAVNTLNAASGFDPTFESYTVGTTPPWVIAIGGAAPTITSGGAFQGSNALNWSVAVSGSTQGIGLNFACIPGQTYTASVYVSQGAANTVSLFINGRGDLATTVAGGRYVRLTGTFVADQPSLQLVVGHRSASSPSSITIDAIQIEPGNAVSPFSSTGPVIYSVFGGFVERWPSSWNFHGTYGMAQLTAVDAFAPMSRQRLWTEVRNAVLGKNPNYYWPLSEPQGVTSFGESSGNGGPALHRLDSPFGPGPTFAAGTQTTMAGDPSGTGLSVNTGNVSTNVPASVAQTGVRTTYIRAGSLVVGASPIQVGGSNPCGWTTAVWASHTTLNSFGGQNQYIVSLGQLPFNNLTQIYGTDGSPNTITASTVWPGSGVTPISVTVTDSWADGHMHLYVLAVNISGTTGTITLYVDGVQVGTNSGSATAGFTNFFYNYAECGGYLNPSDLTAGAAAPGGVYAHLAFWSRALSSGEVADLNNAANGYLNERSDQRIARYLGYRYIAPSSLEVGASTMGVSALSAGTALLDACQNVTTSENGVLVVDPVVSGTIVFQARTHRYLQTTAQWVFGENAANGEIPYLENIAFDYDPTQLYNDIKVTQSGGVVAFGGSQAAVAASQLSYGTASYDRTINVASDLEAQDAANWLFAGHQAPTQRLAQLVISPAANPSIWPTALGVKIGDRATVKRRTSTGYVMSADFFVERIEHSRNDGGQWQVTFQMSPAGGGFNYQPWILENSTLGVLGTTTVLGY